MEAVTATRAIDGLRLAVRCDVPKHASGIKRPRGAKAHGVKYEKSLAKAMPDAKHGQWFQFVDKAGIGYCQTDLVLNFERAVVVLEAKYTWTAQGHFQVERLYKPVLERVFGKPCFGLVICRALTDDMGEVLVVPSLVAALGWCTSKRVALHWFSGEASLRVPDPDPHFGALISARTPILARLIKRA